jgi:hypothetical protein
MTPSQLQTENSRLEELIAALTNEPHTSYDLMREHLEEARFYLLGAMPDEYRSTLKLAAVLLPDIENRGLRDRIAQLLHDQEARPN